MIPFTANKNLFAIVSICLTGILVYMTIKLGQPQPLLPMRPMTSAMKEKAKQRYASEKRLKIFVYLTMTESCLPNELRSPEALGDPSLCHCDIIVLSYKKKCHEDAENLPHVEYVFDPESTWTTGRNLLYKTVKQKPQKYEYYVFMDDDVNLSYINPGKNSLSPWRSYEASLLTTQPLVGVAYKLKFQKMYFNQCKYPIDYDLLPNTWYDAMFNSFRHDVVDYLLPYAEHYVKISAVWSQLYMIMKTDLMFPDQVFHSVKIITSNNKHRPYKRILYDTSTIKTVLTDLRREIPERFIEQLEPRIQYWVDHWEDENVRPPRNCSKLPKPNVSPVPFSYLQNS